MGKTLKLGCSVSIAGYPCFCLFFVVQKLYMGIKLLQMWPFLFGGDLVLFELGMKVNASKAIKVGVLETLLKFETDTKFIRHQI